MIVEHRALRLLDVEAELEGELAGLEGLQADRGLDHHLEDGLGLGPGDLLDLHAAALRGDDPDALGLAVEHVAEIELALERLGDLDIDPLHRLALGPGLDRHQPLAEQVGGRLAHLVIGLARFDAAGLAAGAGMNLRLHRPVPAAELGRGIDRLVGAEGDGALRHRHAEAGQQFLGLILVDVHVSSLLGVGAASPRKPQLNLPFTSRKLSRSLLPRRTGASPVPSA